MQTSAKDLMTDENEIKSQFISWGAPGDNFVGTLIGKREVENQLSDKHEMQTIYEFKMHEGTFHTLDEKKNPVDPAVIINKGDVWALGGKKGIDAQMRNVKIGMIVGMKFIEEKPAKVKGYNPTKVVKVYCAQEMDEAWVKEQTESDTAAAAAMKADEDFENLGK
jgi:hypothetical protein